MIAIAALNGGGGGEPEEYIKSAEVDGNSLYLTDLDDNEIEFTPEGGEQVGITVITDVEPGTTELSEEERELAEKGLIALVIKASRTRRFNAEYDAFKSSSEEKPYWVATIGGDKGYAPTGVDVLAYYYLDDDNIILQDENVDKKWNIPYIDEADNGKALIASYYYDEEIELELTNGYWATVGTILIDGLEESPITDNDVIAKLQEVYNRPDLSLKIGGNLITYIERNDENMYCEFSWGLFSYSWTFALDEDKLITGEYSYAEYEEPKKDDFNEGDGLLLTGPEEEGDLPTMSVNVDGETITFNDDGLLVATGGVSEVGAGLKINEDTGLIEEQVPIYSAYETIVQREGTVHGIKITDWVYGSSDFDSYDSEANAKFLQYVNKEDTYNFYVCYNGDLFKQSTVSYNGTETLWGWKCLPVPSPVSWQQFFAKYDSTYSSDKMFHIWPGGTTPQEINYVIIEIDDCPDEVTFDYEKLVYHKLPIDYLGIRPSYAGDSLSSMNYFVNADENDLVARKLDADSPLYLSGWSSGSNYGTSIALQYDKKDFKIDGGQLRTIDSIRIFDGVNATELSDEPGYYVIANDLVNLLDLWRYSINVIFTDVSVGGLGWSMPSTIFSTVTISDNIKTELLTDFSNYLKFYRYTNLTTGEITYKCLSQRLVTDYNLKLYIQGPSIPPCLEISGMNGHINGVRTRLSVTPFTPLYWSETITSFSTTELLLTASNAGLTFLDYCYKADILKLYIRIQNVSGGYHTVTKDVDYSVTESLVGDRYLYVIRFDKSTSLSTTLAEYIDNIRMIGNIWFITGAADFTGDFYLRVEDGTYFFSDYSYNLKLGNTTINEEQLQALLALIENN